LRHEDRKQIGVEQGRRNFVGEPPQALRGERFLADQAADRSRAIKGTRDDHFAAYGDGMLADRIIHMAPLSSR
jgi:hypothetical protein